MTLEPRLVISFHSITDATAFDVTAKDEGFPGRLIPKPREISSACGTAFMTDVELQAEAEQFIADHALETEGVYVIQFRVYD